MKSSSRIVVGAVSLLLACSASAGSPDPARTRAYIDKGWDTLTRSMDDCSAFGDSKIKTRPVLYVPAELPAPLGLADVARHCNIDVHVLPKKISQVGEFLPDALPKQGLLYLPHPYVVPGGFFNEMYGWDSYFIVLGLLADHRTDLARDMVDNALFEVEHYGAVLNANRTYYLTRSQPPFLGSMIRAVLEDPASFKDPAEAAAWTRHAYALAVRDYSLWLRSEHRAGDTGLARYYDYGGPAPVMEFSDSSYLVGVIDWLVAHPDEGQGFLVKAAEHPDAAEAAQLAKTSCDTTRSKVCAGAWHQGYRLSADFYLGDRAMRESGFDTSFRFGPFSGATHHYASVDLNSLLYGYERDLMELATKLGITADAARWAGAADARRAAMDKYLWRADRGMYMDYDAVAGKSSGYDMVTTFWPLWAGAASKEQAAALQGKLKLFEQKGGLATSDRVSGAQWDAPFGWAPTNWIAASGLASYGYLDDARRISREFTATIDRSLADDGTIREKYNMATGDATVKISAGYKDNVIGFGWSNAVYLKMQELLHAPAKTR
jgi:alpha,alpha-trehalase